MQCVVGNASGERGKVVGQAAYERRADTEAVSASAMLLLTEPVKWFQAIVMG